MLKQNQQREKIMIIKINKDTVERLLDSVWKGNMFPWICRHGVRGVTLTWSWFHELAFLKYLTSSVCMSHTQTCLAYYSCLTWGLEECHIPRTIDCNKAHARIILHLSISILHNLYGTYLWLSTSGAPLWVETILLLLILNKRNKLNASRHYGCFY